MEPLSSSVQGFFRKVCGFALNRIYQQIDDRRKELGLSINKFCALNNIPASTYRNWIHGRSERADVEVIRRMYLSLQMEPSEILNIDSDAQPPAVVSDLQEINETPATTKELDTGLTVLSRLIESNAVAHQAEIQAVRAEMDKGLAARDEQFDRERTMYRDHLREKSRQLHILSGVCAALIAALAACLVLLISK